MKILSLTTFICVLALLTGFEVKAQELRDAMRLYDNTMFSRSRTLFDEISSDAVSSDPEGFEILGQVRAETVGYEALMDDFIAREQIEMLAFLSSFLEDMG